MPQPQAMKQKSQKKSQKYRPPSVGYFVRTATYTAQSTLQLEGLTCQQCVGSVTEQLQTLPGVTDVNVDLVANGTSTATITANPTPSAQQFAAALAEAGYSVVK